MNSVYTLEISDHNAKPKLMFGDPVALIRHDVQNFPEFYKQAERMRSFYWTHDSIDLTKDKPDFQKLNSTGQHIFTANIKRQTVLDSIQGRALVEMYQPFISDASLEEAIWEVSYFERIHARTYSYIIQNLYSNPSEVFDNINSIPEITDLVKDINKYYDGFIWQAQAYLGNGEYQTQGYESLYELKKSCLLSIYAWNALEAIRFMASFSCSFAFAENNLMHGNASLIRKIAFDEQLHQAVSTMLIKRLIQTDEDFAKANKELELQIINIYDTVLNQEMDWARYLFKDGSILGLNEKLLISYLKEVAYKRTRAVNVNLEIEDVPTEPTFPWIDHWFKGGTTQTAPQEKNITEYIIGKVKKDLGSESFKDIEL